MSAPEKVEITLPKHPRDAVVTLNAYAEQLGSGFLKNLADQIEAQLPTPEPTRLAAVIRDGIGHQWVATRVSPTSKRLTWTRHDGRRRRWGDIPQPVTVLHEGWKPEDEASDD